MAVIEIRKPETPEELADTQRAKNEAWAFLPNKDEIGPVSRIYGRFPDGCLTAFVDGVAAGSFTLMPLHYDLNDPPKLTWEELTGNGSGSPMEKDGDTLYGISLGVSPRFRGHNLGSMLVNAALKQTVALNYKRFALGCRIPDYHKHSEIPVETYITLKRYDGEFLDAELRFYSRCGLRFLKPLPEYMSGEWADPDCLNYGVLSVWNNPYYRKDK